MIRLAAAIALLGSTTIVAMQPTFSSRVEGVRVDVLVTDSSRRPLRGLTAADFSIRDNGVPQQVDVVSFGETSLNVGLAFDLSESVVGERARAIARREPRLDQRSCSPPISSPLVTFDQVVHDAVPARRSNRSCVERRAGCGNASR